MQIRMENQQNFSFIKKAVFFLAILLVLFFLSACSFSLAQDVPPPTGFQPEEITVTPSHAALSLLYPLVPPDPVKGKVIYIEECSDCHGLSGLGNGEKAADLPNPTTAIGDPQIARRAVPGNWFLMITEGNLERYMPPFQSLTDRQRWDVLAYTFSLSASKDSVHAGSIHYQTYCVDCHGELGHGDGMNADNFKASLPDFHNQEYITYKAQIDFYQVISEGAAVHMPAFADQLSQGERWALTGFLSSLSFVTTGVETSQEAISTEEEPAEEPHTTVPQTAPSNEQLQSAGIISGFIKNISGGALPIGEEITLHAFDQKQLVFTETVSLSEAGSFMFEDIEMPTGRAFLVSINYEGAIFGSDIAFANPENPNLELFVEIYETTTDASILFVNRLHYFFELIDEETFQVVELYVISNPSNQTLVSASEDQPAILFTLPDDAINLEFQDGVLGGRYVLTDNGFGDLLPVRPGMGQHQIMFSYQMPFSSRKLTFNRQMNFDTDAIVILIPEDGIKIKGETIQDVGTRDVRGIPYRMYNGQGLHAGQEIYLEITERSTAIFPAIVSGSNSELILGVGALGIALIIAGGWLYLHKQSGDEELVDGYEFEEQPSIENAETVMDAILTLDDLYQEGQLPEKAYIQRRSELKGRLAELLDE